MPKSTLLSVLAAAARGDLAELAPDSGKQDVPMGGRPDTQEEENSMSVNDGKPAAAILAGITDEALNGVAKEATAAALEQGKAEGAKAERERLSGILGAEGIKGDGNRMSAALDLAAKSPEMSADDVTAFVTANVAANKDNADPEAAYETARTTASGLTSPVPAPKAKSRSLNSGSIYDARRNQGRKE